MIDGVVAALLELVRQYGFVAILVLMAAESACLPVPSEPVMVFGGYLVFTKALSFTAVTLAGTLGNLLGSLLAYFVGARSEEAIYARYADTPLVGHKLKTAEKWFHRYGEPAVFFARLLPVVRTFISLPAGVAHMSFARFLTYTVVGSLIWNAALAYAGLVAGPHWKKATVLLHDVTYLVLAAVVVLLALAGWMLWRRSRGRQSAGEETR